MLLERFGTYPDGLENRYTKNTLGELKMNRMFAFVGLIVAASLLTAGCAKKTIQTEPSGSPSYSSTSGEEAAEAWDAGSAERDRGVQEESLAEAGARSQALTAEAAAAREAMENRDILFEFDSAVLSADAQEILRDKARWLQSNPGVTVILEGHCDDRGTNEYNLALGEKRARSARKFLMTLGVDGSRLSTVSYGEERPLIPGVSEEARSRNRRVHFVIES
jgi:peptidoglycan-associated lipoprotein